MPVVWENHADPILTGREQLGWSKIYADMDTPKEHGRIIQERVIVGLSFWMLVDLNDNGPMI